LSRLFVIGTPIGNLEDTTARAVRVLGEVGSIAAEDTRVTARLLARHGIRKPLISYRAPVERRGLPRVLSALDEHDVALVSDAARRPCRTRARHSSKRRGRQDTRWCLYPARAPSRRVSVAGYGGPGFTFLGYLPRKPGEIRRLLATIAGDPRPAVAFEFAYRVHKSLAIVAEVLPERQLTVAESSQSSTSRSLRGKPPARSSASSASARAASLLL